MRRLPVLLLPLMIVAAFVAPGCGKKSDPKPPQVGPQVADPGKPNQPNLLPPNIGQPNNLPPAPLEQIFQPVANSDQQEKYEAALAEALTHLIDGHTAQALASFETAQRFNDSDFVKGEIAKTKLRLQQETAAQKTATSIQTIIEEGKADEAAKIAKDALKEFGSSDLYGDQFVKLRLQAEAIQATTSKEDAASRHRRFKEEGQAALQEQNLRAAALAFDQALLAQADAGVQTQLEDCRAKLQKYDELRAKAAQLRRDADHLEDALAALQEAGQFWNTLILKQEIDEVEQAIRNRRDRVAVAEFEVRGNLGIADAGRTIAEELLPTLKGRFDLVEHTQINKVLDELKLDEPLDIDPAGQRELGRVAKVRFLVLGSISRLPDLVASARLVDVRSGLVVQTGRIHSATPEELFRKLPELGKQLLMSDEEKILYDQQQVQVVQRPAPIQVAAEVPPLPQQAPALQAQGFGVPPQLGDLNQQAFQFPAAPAPGVGLPVIPPGGADEIQTKRRLLFTMLEMGDYLFRTGRPAEAHRYFSFALSLDPYNPEILARLDLCQPPVIITRPVVLRPRLAVLSFAIFGNPAFVPPYLSTWTPQHLTPYLACQYDIVDPNEVFWMMNRMGMSVHDVMHHPHQRRWLGRALNVRYFLVGNLIHTASFDCNSYLIDAEYGYLQGQGHVHVRGPFELKLRLGELARETLLDPRTRTAYVNDGVQFQTFVASGQQYFERRQYDQAINAFQSALKIRVGNVEVQVYLNKARSLQQQMAFEEARRQAMLRQQAEAEAAARRQWQLSQTAQFAAIAPGIGLVINIGQKQQAQASLLLQARTALKARDYGPCIQHYESAIALDPRDELYRELAQAKAEQVKAQQIIAAQQVALIAAKKQQARDQELALAKQQIEFERQKALAAQVAAKKAQEERDHLAYQTAFDEGQRYLAAGKYEMAVSSLQTARRVKRTEAVESMINFALSEQAKASAKNDAEKVALENKLKMERELRKKAQEQNRITQEKYQAALDLAHKALAKKDYDVAQVQYEEAGKIFKTDAVLTGLKQIESGRIAEKLAFKKKLDEQQKEERIQGLLAQAQSAYDAKQFDSAYKLYDQAKKMSPDNVDVLAGLAKAQTARDRLAGEMRKKNEDDQRLQNFQKLLKSGQDNLTGKQYDAAVVALAEAVKLNPGSTEARAALASAQKLQANSANDAKTQAANKEKLDQYQKHLSAGKFALSTNRYDEAIQAFTAAQKLLPGDKTSADFLEDARQKKADGETAQLKLFKKKAEEARIQGEIKKALDDGRLSMGKNDFVAAGKAFQQASDLAPNDPQVKRALFDLQQAQQQSQLLAKQNEEKELQAKDLLAKQQRAKKLIGDAQTAVGVKDVAAASKALDEAKSLTPNDPAIAKLETQVNSLKENLVGAQKQALAYKQALSVGQDLLREKKYPEAITALTEANKLRPGDPTAGQLIQQAQREWNDAKDSAATQAKQGQYLKAITLGQSLFSQKKYEEAIQAFQEASKLNPGDQKAALFIQQAQKASLDAKNDAAQAASKAADYTKAMTLGQSLFSQKKYEEAIQAFQEASKLNPGDQKAALFIQQAQKASLDAKNDAAQAASKAADYTKAMTLGQNLLAQKKYTEAMQAFSDAARLNPGDPKATLFIQQAKKAIADDAAAKEDTQKKALELQRQTQYKQAMIQAQTAMSQKRYADAQGYYQSALRLIPNDPSATRGLQEATQQLNASKTPPKKIEFPKKAEANPPAGNDAYQTAMDSAKGFERQFRFQDAIGSYQKALAAKPNDAQAQQSLKLATFSMHYTEGDKALKAGQTQAAIQHLEQALQVSPGNPAASALLARAKQQKLKK